MEMLLKDAGRALMKWRGRNQSRNIEDRRRSRGGKAGGMGILGIVAVLAISYFTGIDVSGFVGGLNDGGQSSVQTGELSAEEKASGEFVSVVLSDTEVIWNDIFTKQLGKQYRPATLVLFSQATSSPCGSASGATGPFYCPADRKAYLDTAFFSTMQRKFGATGDFAAAYVVAHEIAHHVQNELGVLGNDLREAINAAKQIGDDTLQRNAGRRPMPHTFTHGTSEQRMRWFATGYQSGSIDQCDTFAAQNL